MAARDDLSARRRARAGLAQDADRAGARSHFRAMGIDPERLAGPVVGIASTWTGTMPCNLNHRELADAVGRGVETGGGVPLPFNTIAVSDNQTQATPGMRASLVSRELIADSIELLDIAHDFDALVCIVGCDKTVPAALMALARVDKPAVVLYSGPMRPGAWRGEPATIQDVWEQLGAFHAGRLSRADLDELERTACPGPGTCAGHFTANTMGLALEFLGIAPLGEAMVPADDREQRARAAERCGELATRLPASGRTARDFLDRRALRNAMAGIAATGGSTNGILHLLAIAREAGVELGLDELVAVSQATPVIASLAPSGRYLATDLHAVGGGPAVLAELIRAAWSTVTRRPSRAARSPRRRRPRRSRTARSCAARPHPSRPPAGCSPCAATSRPRAPWSRSRAPSAVATAGRRACSTPRRPAWRPSTPAR